MDSETEERFKILEKRVKHLENNLNAFMRMYETDVSQLKKDNKDLHAIIIKGEKQYLSLRMDYAAYLENEHGENPQEVMRRIDKDASEL